MNVQVRPRRFRERCYHRVEGESMCERSHAPSTDINAIIARYHRTGELPPPRHTPIYEDVTGLQGDFRERLAFLDRVKSQVEAHYKAQADALEAEANAAKAALTPSPDTPPAS